MIFYAFGTALVLASFAVVNAIVSTAVIGLAPAALAALAGTRASRRARVLLALRLLPAVAAAVVAGGLVLPAYLLFEPAHAGERITPPLALLAAGALVLVALGLRRGRRALASTSALERRWRMQAEAIAVPDSPVPVYRVRDAFPVFTVVGFHRPSLYVSDRVLAALSPDEVAAAVAHERGHLEADDNVKRLLFRASPDLVAFSPLSGMLEREWVRAAEERADERAGRSGRAAALALASSLVKVARLVPAPPDGLPVSALHDGGDVAARVRHLVADPCPSEDAAPRKALRILAGATVAALGLAAAQAWPAVHEMIEVAARLLH
jgi:beta-lactamase regulating signal transducer with metallopeptidase domain